MRLILILLLLGCLVQPALSQPADTVRRIDELFSSWNNATPGGVALVAKGEKIIYHKAFGLADLEHNVPNTTETIFESGSVAKQFTAMAILLLAADGKLSLQDEIQKYVPEIPKYAGPVRIQHLLNHTSGLKDWGSVGSLTGFPRTTKVYTQDLALQIMSKQKSTNFYPGNEYSYSNSNYSLLVTIVERVSGQSLQEFTKANFFDPLGMMHTEWRTNFRKIIPNRAIAYSRNGTNYQQDMPFEHVHGHGGLLFTSGDLLKWNSLLETKKIGGEKVYQMRVQKGRLNNGQEINYAAGLNNALFNGFQSINHSGATAGYRSWLVYYPQKKLTVLLLSNDGSADVVSIGRQIALMYLGKSSIPAKERKKITLSDAEAKKFDGTYRSVRHFDVQKLEFKNGKIYSNDRELLASHADSLYLDDLSLSWSKPGLIRMTNSFGDTLSYAKVLPPDKTPFYQNSLVGAYKSDEADATYEISLKDNDLWMRVKPFKPFKLEAAIRDGFFYSDGLVEFKRGKNKKMEIMEISIPRAERIPFIKQ